MGCGTSQQAPSGVMPHAVHLPGTSSGRPMSKDGTLTLRAARTHIPGTYMQAGQGMVAFAPSFAHQSTGFTPTTSNTPVSSTPPGTSRPVSSQHTAPLVPIPIHTLPGLMSINSTNGLHSHSVIGTNTMAVTGPSLPTVSASATPLNSTRVRHGGTSHGGGTLSIRPAATTTANGNGDNGSTPSAAPLPRWSSLRNTNIHGGATHTPSTDNNHATHGGAPLHNGHHTSHEALHRERSSSDLRRGVARKSSSRALDLTPNGSPATAQRRSKDHVLSPASIMVHSPIPPSNPHLSIDPTIEEHKHENNNLDTAPTSPKIIVTPSGERLHKPFASIYPDDPGNSSPMTSTITASTTASLAVKDPSSHMSRKGSRRSKSMKRQSSKREKDHSAATLGLMSTTESFRQSMAGLDPGLLSTTSHRRSRSRSKSRSALMSATGTSTRSSKGVVIPVITAPPDLNRLNSQRRGSLFRNETLSHHQWDAEVTRNKNRQNAAARNDNLVVAEKAFVLTELIHTQMDRKAQMALAMSSK